MFVKFLHFGGSILTTGRIYRVLAISGAFFIILDDNGIERSISVNWFAII